MMDVLPGPLTLISRAIEDRLKAVMPPTTFTYRWLPAKMDAKVWELLIQNCPAISLEYAGFIKAENAPGLLGDGIWNIWLAVKNISSAEAALFGDKLAPHGALAVHQVAMVALHGMKVAGAGTVTVVKAEPVALIDRGDPGIYAVCVTVVVNRMSIASADVLTGDIATAGTLVTEDIAWTFGSGTEVDQTDLDTDTISNAGTS